MNNPSDLERVVMRRVRLIRIFGLIVSTVVFAALTLIAALWGIGREVWVVRVFQNAPMDLQQLPAFFITTFTHTRFVVQVLATLTLASLAYLCSEVVRLATNFIFRKPA